MLCVLQVPHAHRMVCAGTPTHQATPSLPVGCQTSTAPLCVSAIADMEAETVP